MESDDIVLRWIALPRRCLNTLKFEGIQVVGGEMEAGGVEFIDLCGAYQGK